MFENQAGNVRLIKSTLKGNQMAKIIVYHSGNPLRFVMTDEQGSEVYTHIRSAILNDYESLAAPPIVEFFDGLGTTTLRIDKVSSVTLVKDNE